MQEIKRVPDFHTFCTAMCTLQETTRSGTAKVVSRSVQKTFSCITPKRRQVVMRPLRPRNPETTCGKSAKTIFAFCQKCPTWVLHGDSISIVAACGVRGKYTGWAWDENSGTSALLLDVNFASILVVHNYEL